MHRHFAIVLALSGLSTAAAQSVDPRGVFFHEYTAASFAGVEWVTMVDVAGDRRYEFSDIRALTPFSGTIATDGTTVWDAGAVTGTGSFSTQDRAHFDVIFGSTPVALDLWRAPATTPDFITWLDSPVDGSASLAGEFRVTVDQLDPMTGAVIGTRDEMMMLEVAGQTLRLTEADGDFIQGVFEDADAVGFRVVTPLAARPEYRTFVGSETNRGLNVMADLRFNGTDGFTATVLLQTRTSPGAQTQFVERYTAHRVPAPGMATGLLALGVFARRRRE